MKPIAAVHKQHKASIKTPLEYHEAVTLTEYLELLKKQGKIVVFSHVSNETYVKSHMVRRMHTLQGLRPGVPDYIIVTPDKLLFLELKRISESKVSMDQITWIDALNDAGVKAMICYGSSEAIQFVLDNL